MRKLLAVPFCFLFFETTGFSQENVEKTLESFQEIITEISSRTDDASSAEELADELMHLAKNPIKINVATAEELGKLFWLNEFQLHDIQEYISKNGPLKTIYEIPYIKGFTVEDAKLLGPFILFDSDEKKNLASPEKLISQGNHRLLWRMQRIPEKQKGYEVPDNPTASNHFTGDPIKLYFRYDVQLKTRVDLGITAEKDPGEPYLTGKNKCTPDFFSGHLQINDLKMIKSFVLGDYRLNFGQGLVLWTGFSFGKSTAILSSMQRTTGIRSYQSTDENNFFRGSAMTFKIKPLEISVFYSRNKLDGNIVRKDSTTGKTLEVSSLQTSGIHGLPSEIADKDALTAEVYGANWSFVRPDFRLGLTGIYYRYSATINPDLQPYNEFYFRGKSTTNLSVDYKFRRNNLLFFGEEAYSGNGGWAFLNGLEARASSRLNISLISRYYQVSYQAMYGNSFGENSRNNNEAGLFAGFESHPLKFISVSGYIDLFRFPWLKYGVDMPSEGRDFLVQVGFHPVERIQLTFQYRNKLKGDNSSATESLKNDVVSATSNRYRFNFQYEVNERICIRNRLEWSGYQKENSGVSTGFYVGQDAEFSLKRIPLKVYLRYALFDTGDYNCRIYAYENDLLYTFSIPALFDKGSRMYAMVKYSIGKKLDIWIKYGILQYADKLTVGTDVYESQGNQRSEIKCQILVKF